jgi:hypothetical protein
VPLLPLLLEDAPVELPLEPLWSIRRLLLELLPSGPTTGGLPPDEAQAPASTNTRGAKLIRGGDCTAGVFQVQAEASTRVVGGLTFQRLEAYFTL